MRSPSTAARLAKSLLLGATLLVLVAWGLERSPVVPISYFGGAKLAQKYIGLEELDQIEDVEILAVGSSFVDLGFDAEHFSELTGKTTYNMGIPGTDIYFQSLFLRQVLIPRFQPEAILWGVRDSTRTKSSINHQYLASPALRHSAGPLGGLTFELERPLPHMKRRRFTDWIQAVFGPSGRDFDAYGATKRDQSELQRKRAGAEPVEVVEGGAGEAAVVRARDERLRMRDEYTVSEEEARREFERTLAFARERGIRVVLFFTPYFESTFRPRSNYARRLRAGEFASYHEWMMAALREHDASLVNLRFCEEISTRPYYFFDTRHLNRLGAPRTTAILAELYLGKRTLPEEWSTLPSQAELRAIGK